MSSCHKTDSDRLRNVEVESGCTYGYEQALSDTAGLSTLVTFLIEQRYIIAYIFTDCAYLLSAYFICTHDSVSLVVYISAVSTVKRRLVKELPVCVVRRRIML